MKPFIELIKTKESDGNWYKVYVDGNVKSCTKIYDDTASENLARAEEIYNFYIETNGTGKQVIKSNE